MPIDLGLARITKLLSHLGDPQKSIYNTIHIAGTNGKGSTVSYLSSILTSSKIRNGKFTSPHLLYYNDCISIDNETYPLSKFDKVNNLVQSENKLLKLNCTEFEILTVTAFKIFEIEKVELAVIEVGLGGRLDATNVLEPASSTNSGVIVSGITKIGIDHEGLLGDTISEIAAQKAGIIKLGIPVVTDITNDTDTLRVIEETAKTTNSKLYQTGSINDDITISDKSLTLEGLKKLLSLSPLKGSYQLQNLNIALKISQLLQKESAYRHRISHSSIVEGIRRTKWPGRLQYIKLPNKSYEILLDGAHNESAAVELGSYLTLNHRTKKDDNGIIFIIALSKGKSIDKLLKHITIKDKDTLIATNFTVPDQMPWVSSYSIEELQPAAKLYVNDVRVCDQEGVESLLSSIDLIKKKGDERQVVICGSLYLCSDILRYFENNKI